MANATHAVPQPKDYRLIVEKDVQIPLRDGASLCADELPVEIWPTSMVFCEGHRLRLDISPAHGVGTQHFTHFHADYNQGAQTTIHAGGDKPSYLLLPVIPAKKG